MSVGSAGVIVPDAVARQRNMQQAIIGGIFKLRRDIAIDVYTKIVASEYHLRAMAAVKKAEQDANPFGARDDDEVAEEIKAVPVAVDVNTAAKISLQAADCLLYHLDLIDSKGNIRIQEEEAPAEPATGQSSIVIPD